jgi:flagellar basal-body rod protein FlgB
MSSTSIENTLGLIERSMDLVIKRGKIIASNVAHSETPNYKAMDVDFEGVLARTQGDKGVVLARTHEQHFVDSSPETSFPVRCRLDSEGEARADGNTVNLEEEMAKSAANQIRFQALTQALNRVFSNLREAITEGGRR